LVWAVAGAAIMVSYDKIVVFRFINGHYNATLDTLMFMITRLGQAEVIIPVLASFMLFKRYRTLWYFSLATACNLIPMIVQQSLKSFFNWPRPLHYFEHTSWVHLVEGWDRVFERSFPSGHSAGAFSFFCFLSLMLAPAYRAWGLLFFCLALLAGYSRVYLAAHFFEDVYAGSLIGYAMTTIVFVAMHRWFDKANQKSF
jgi:membrane-associated phospholipid phosphatase